MKDHGSYWIVRARGMKETPPARSFREWLMSEMADTNRKYAQLTGQRTPPVAARPASA
jgi:hypothetical protein